MGGYVSRFILAPAVLLAALWIPANAAATTYCVVKAGSCPAGQTREGSVQAALTAASTDLPGPNVVQIGPGTYDAAGPGFDYSTVAAPPVHIVGAGPGQTMLDSGSGPAFILRLAIGGSSVEDLQAVCDASLTEGCEANAPTCVSRLPDLLTYLICPA